MITKIKRTKGVDFVSNKFIYCFDKDLADELSKTLKVLFKNFIDGKECWIFVADNKIDFNKLDNTKVFVSNRLNF